MALAALGAAAVLDVGSATAEAARSVSPFAGSYVGADPQGWVIPVAVRISDGGQISSSYLVNDAKGPISGRVGDDGSYVITVTTIVPDYFDRRGGREHFRVSYKSTGTLAPDAAGNLVGTDDNGGSFSWLRR